MTIGKTEADYYRHRISVIKLLRRFIMSHVKRNKNEKKKKKTSEIFRPLVQFLAPGEPQFQTLQP